MYKQELVNAFIDPAKQIWEKELGTSLKLRSADTVSIGSLSDDVTAVISIKGQVKGAVLYGFSRRTARAIVSTMLGQKVKDLDDVAGSAISELANMITLHATAQLANSGYSCEFKSPIIVDTPGTTIKLGESQAKIAFTSELGELNVMIALVGEASQQVAAAANARTSQDSLGWLWQRWQPPEKEEEE